MMIESRAKGVRYRTLVEDGLLPAPALRKAEEACVARGLEMEEVLLRDARIPKQDVLRALSRFHGLPVWEYDERTPLPPSLLERVDAERLSAMKWVPVASSGTKVVVAVNDPGDPDVAREIGEVLRFAEYEIRVALEEDILWTIQDYLNASPGLLIGTERTGLAYWRNTMAHWRTRLAGYRTDLATARTSLAVLRWGLGMIAMADALMRSRPEGGLLFLRWPLLAAGIVTAMAGLPGYLRVRKRRMHPPGHATLIEVTAATLSFLEKYHDIPETGMTRSTKGTMLARLGDLLGCYSTILAPSPESRVRTHLARERNVLAGQRTVAACYRTIYARSRTGLAFARTGIAFASLGLGLIRYYGFSLLTVADFGFVAAGITMIADGLGWYLPVRKEQAELPRCPVPETGGR